MFYSIAIPGDVQERGVVLDKHYLKPPVGDPTSWAAFHGVEPPLTAAVYYDENPMFFINESVWVRDPDTKSDKMSPHGLPFGKEIDAADVMSGELIYFIGNVVYNGDKERLGTIISPCDGVDEDVIKTKGIFTPDAQ